MASFMRASGLTPRQPVRVVTPPTPPQLTTPQGAVSTHIVPSQSNVYNLGSREFPFKEAYFGKNTVYLGDTPLGVDASGNFLAINSVGQTAFANDDVTENYMVAVGSDTSGNTIQWSVDGANWYLPQSNSLAEGRTIAWNGSVWVAAGSSVVVSIDGHTWSSPLTPPIFNGIARAVGWNGTNWVLVADDGAIGANRTIYWSPDAQIWTLASSTSQFSNSTVIGQGNAVASDGTRFVVLGQGDRQIMFSDDDGLTFSPNIVGDGFSYSGNAAAYNGSVWVASGINVSNEVYTQSVQWSSNGSNWSNASGPFGIPTVIASIQTPGT